MSKPALVTAELDVVTLALLDKAAQANGRTRAEFAAEAIRRVAESEADFLAFVQEGRDSAERQPLLSQDEMERWFADRRHRHAAE